MEKINYTKEEVLELLEKQRELCLKKGKIKSWEYVNPYSDADGRISYYIDENSILKANLEL